MNRVWLLLACLAVGLGLLAFGAVLGPLSIEPGTPSQPVVQGEPGTQGHPTLADFWAGTAEFVLQVRDTGPVSP